MPHYILVDHLILKRCAALAHKFILCLKWHIAIVYTVLSWITEASYLLATLQYLCFNHLTGKILPLNTTLQ